MLKKNFSYNPIQYHILDDSKIYIEQNISTEIYRIYFEIAYLKDVYTSFNRFISIWSLLNFTELSNQHKEFLTFEKWTGNNIQWWKMMHHLCNSYALDILYESNSIQTKSYHRIKEKSNKKSNIQYKMFRFFNTQRDLLEKISKNFDNFDQTSIKYCLLWYVWY